MDSHLLVRDHRELRRCARDGESLWGGSLHHRKLRSQNGADSCDNLVGLCGSGTTGCHGWAHHNRDDAAREGWIVPSHVDPATVPVKHFVWGWVLLLPNGDVHLLAKPPENNDCRTVYQ